MSPSTYTQKYTLQRRNELGYFEKVATLDREIGPDQALKDYGPGYFILKATKPRFKTVWKRQLGEVAYRNQFKVLERRTKILGVGLFGLAASEAAGFWLTHRRFSALEERTDNIEAVLRRFKPVGAKCPCCTQQLDFWLQKFCGQCGRALGWTGKQSSSWNRRSSECPRCRFNLLDHDVYCPECGQKRLVQGLYELKAAPMVFTTLSASMG